MVLNDKLNPTYYGYIGSTKDALLIMQATLNNQLLAVPRRPHDKERSLLIQSGNIFVFIEERSGIKRWTDSIAWSPSRILGRFLVYRELDKLALNESTLKSGGDDSSSTSSSSKRRKRKKQDSISEQNQQQLLPSEFDMHMTYDTMTPLNKNDLQANEAYNNLGSANGTVTSRSLVGSLVASYAFKDRGLIKKTLSVTITDPQQRQSESILQTNTETIHLVSYYSADDVISGKLKRPSDSPNFKNLQISVLLYNALRESNLGSKAPLEDETFYFFDTNNNLVSMPNPTPQSIAEQQQQKQQQQQLQLQQLQQQQSSTPSTITYLTSTTAPGSYSARSSIHDPYQTSQLVPLTNNSNSSNNSTGQPPQLLLQLYWQLQQLQQLLPIASNQQQLYWQQQPYYQNQQTLQYWQLQQPREGSISSVSSVKKNSPIQESAFPSNYNTLLQQQQYSSNYNPYPNQYHINLVPKFVQPQYQYLSQPQQKQPQPQSQQQRQPQPQPQSQMPLQQYMPQYAYQYSYPPVQLQMPQQLQMSLQEAQLVQLQQQLQLQQQQQQQFILQQQQHSLHQLSNPGILQSLMGSEVGDGLMPTVGMGLNSGVKSESLSPSLGSRATATSGQAATTSTGEAPLQRFYGYEV